ncbi:hypothetical protein C8R46DRAFT_430275 [Mycena filopes]|nr:hypothetical protein C8R46DRAFT_430275 [Mycena filopes]
MGRWRGHDSELRRGGPGGARVRRHPLMLPVLPRLPCSLGSLYVGLRTTFAIHTTLLPTHTASSASSTVRSTPPSRALLSLSRGDWSSGKRLPPGPRPSSLRARAPLSYYPSSPPYARTPSSTSLSRAGATRSLERPPPTPLLPRVGGSLAPASCSSR